MTQKLITEDLRKEDLRLKQLAKALARALAKAPEKLLREKEKEERRNKLCKV